MNDLIFLNGEVSFASSFVNYLLIWLWIFLKRFLWSLHILRRLSPWSIYFKFSTSLWFAIEFLVTALLIYNSHILMIIHCKCEVQWMLVYLWICTRITKIWLKNIFITFKNEILHQPEVTPLTSLIYFIFNRFVYSVHFIFSWPSISTNMEPVDTGGYIIVHKRFEHPQILVSTVQSWNQTP